MPISYIIVHYQGYFNVYAFMFLVFSSEYLSSVKPMVTAKGGEFEIGVDLL
jgi:hypothetical protein